MTVTDACRDQLKDRYRGNGDQVGGDAFYPFGGSLSLTDTISRVVWQLNISRLRYGQSQGGGDRIELQWLHADLCGPTDSARRDKAEDIWTSGHALLVVDSLSTLCQAVRDPIRDLAVHPQTTTVLWVPPYTQKSDELQKATAEAAQKVRHIQRLCRDWKAPNPRRTCAHWHEFAIATQASLRHWVFRTCPELVRPHPNEGNVDAMEQPTPRSGPTPDASILSTGPGPGRRP